MITITVNGIVLPIAQGQQLVREIETNFLNKEAEVSDFTYPIDIPLTDEVKRAFKMPHVVSTNTYAKEQPGTLSVSGLFISSVTVRIVRVINATGIMQISLLGDYGSFGKVVGDKKVNELNLGGVRNISGHPPTHYFYHVVEGYEKILQINYQGCDTDVHMKDIATGNLVTDYVFYPFVDENPNLPEIHSESCRSLVNIWDVSQSRYPDPLVTNMFSMMLGKADRYFWVPQFRISYILRCCFEEFGLKVLSPLLSDANFTKIALHNTYAINECTSWLIAVNSGIDGLHLKHMATSIDPRNHVPSMRIVDFISEVAKYLNLQYIFDWTAQTVTWRQISQPTQDGSLIVDISKNVLNDPEIGFEDKKYDKGFRFKYDNTEELVREDIDTFTLAGTVNRTSDLAGLTAANNNLAFVRNLNAYYQKQGTEWLFFSHNLGEYKTSTENDLMELATKCQPTAMRTVTGMRKFVSSYPVTPYVPIQVTYVAEQIMPVTNIGIEGKNMFWCRKINDDERMDRQFGWWNDLVNVSLEYDTIYVANWYGMQQAAVNLPGDLFPYATVTNSDAQSSSPNLAGWRLCWNDPDNMGVYKSCRWKDIADALKGSVTAKYQVMVDTRLYHQLQNINWVVFQINGQLFRTNEASITMPFPEVSEFSFIRM